MFKKRAKECPNPPVSPMRTHWVPTPRFSIFSNINTIQHKSWIQLHLSSFRITAESTLSRDPLLTKKINHNYMIKKFHFLISMLTRVRAIEMHRLGIIRWGEQRVRPPLTQDAPNNRPIFHKLLNILLIINNTELHLIFKNKPLTIIYEINIIVIPLFSPLLTRNRPIPPPSPPLLKICSTKPSKT